MNNDRVRSALIAARAALPDKATDLIDTINDGLLELEAGKIADPFKIETSKPAPPIIKDCRNEVFVCEDCETQIAVNWMLIDGKVGNMASGDQLKAWSLTCPNCGGECCVM